MFNMAVTLNPEALRTYSPAIPKPTRLQRKRILYRIEYAKENCETIRKLSYHLKNARIETLEVVYIPRHNVYVALYRVPDVMGGGVSLKLEEV
ncbi:MAG: hypothetical protein QXI11_03845 [Thermoproteota archaeon]